MSVLMYGLQTTTAPFFDMNIVTGTKDSQLKRSCEL